MPDRAEKYIHDVKKGRKPVGKTIKKAVQRHLDDLRKSRQKDYPYFFSATHAAGAIEAVEVQKFAYEAKAGQPFTLEPWQAFILYLAYGWRRKKDHSRRFLKAYIKIARGNGKTELLAAIGNIGFFFEAVNDPQIWWVSSTVTQSQIGFGRQKSMAEYLINEDPTFNELYGLRAQRIYEKAGGGYVGFLSSKPKDGFSPLYGLIDEYHEFMDDARIHSLESGMIKRAHPFTWIITTAGNNPGGPCEQFETRAKQMLDGDVENDQLLAIIFDLDDGDDWENPVNWYKANPNLGVSLHLGSLQSEFEKAKSEGIVKENNFKAKNLNIWGASRQGWISDEKFKASGKKFDPATLDGALCFGGLDLSKNRDITALALLYPPKEDGGKFHALFRFWCPEDNARERNRLDGIPYLQWARDGWLNITPGDLIDTDYIANAIRQAKDRYRLHSVAYDRYRATELVKDLNQEFGHHADTQTNEWLEPYTQTTLHMTAPLQEIEKLLLKRQLNHGRNPVIEWMNRNVVIYMDGNGNFKLDKRASKEKIDGMVALAMAVGQYMTYKHLLVEAYSESDVYIL